MKDTLKRDLRTIAISLAVSALVVGGPAIAHGVHAMFAHNADKVDGLHASKRPQAGKLLALNGKKRLPTGLASGNSLGGAACTGINGQKGLIIQEFHPDPYPPADSLHHSGRLMSHYFCITADAFEPNDTKAAQSNLTVGNNCRARATVFPSGDDDWYGCPNTDTTGDAVALIPPGRNLNASLSMDVYVNGARVAEKVKEHILPAGMNTVEVRVDSVKATDYEVVILCNPNCI